MDLIPVLLAVSMLLWILYKRQQKKALNRRLGREGMPAKAEIIGRHERRIPKGGGRRYYLKYRFRTLKGETVEQRVVASRDEYQSVEEGGQIDIHYLTDDPDTSRTRAFLQRKGLLG